MNGIRQKGDVTSGAERQRQAGWALGLLVLLSAARTEAATTYWSRYSQLNPSSGLASNLFARAIGLSGDTAILSTADNTAYINIRSGINWYEEKKISGLDKPGFGSTVALSGETALIGAFADSTRAANAGAAYVHVRSGDWPQQARLLASDGAADDSFGSAVAISGNIALVGAKEHDSGATNAGAVYVFDRAGVPDEQL